MLWVVIVGVLIVGVAVAVIGGWGDDGGDEVVEARMAATHATIARAEGLEPPRDLRSVR